MDRHRSRQRHVRTTTTTQQRPRWVGIPPQTQEPSCLACCGNQDPSMILICESTFWVTDGTQDYREIPSPPDTSDAEERCKATSACSGTIAHLLIAATAGGKMLELHGTLWAALLLSSGCHVDLCSCEPPSRCFDEDRDVCVWAQYNITVQPGHKTCAERLPSKCLSLKLGFPRSETHGAGKCQETSSENIFCHL